MNKKLYFALSSAFYLVCCSSQEDVVPVTEQVVRGALLPIEQRVISNAVVLNKKVLSGNREQYIVRFNDGREVYFTANPSLNYKVGDSIHLPS